MSEIYYIVGIFIFISILYIEKYTDLSKITCAVDKLKEWIETTIHPDVKEDSETPDEEREDEVEIDKRDWRPQVKDELQDIHDLIEEYIIRNPDIFSRHNIKDE